MIKHTFLFLLRISAKKEQTLWQNGIKDWQDFLKTEKIKGISIKTKLYYNHKLKEAQQALQENNSSWFIGKLPPKEMWRLYDYFKEESCFLDVEVDSHEKVIMVGISNYYQTNQFVVGVNLEKDLLQTELEKYKLLITFNGSAFDLPKLKKQFSLEIKIPHLDLKPPCLNLGWKGGLKEIETQLNLKRPAHLRGSPVDLWKAFHASGDREYLELLLEYNREDIENLKAITEKIYLKLSLIFELPIFSPSSKQCCLRMKR